MVSLEQESKHYMHIPNGGSYGIKRLQDDSGILIDISASLNPATATKTCVTCIVESGKKGQGCTCSQTTKTVCCNTEGCSPSCGTGFQCIWDCNRDIDACTELCNTIQPFEDRRIFSVTPSGDIF